MTSAPRIEALSESASAVNRTASRTTTGCARSSAAVSAEPVNATESCPPRWSSRSPALPHSSCTEPSGSSPDSMIRRNAASVR
ncbi:Uncharacterised protein [Mycobacteroides abscessus subsp. abscessus]|nr:Uncharacterised protein [Mycobacteroides abscessus subsp. abscessus]